MYIYIYIYIDRETERERREMGEGCEVRALCVCLHFSEEILRILQVGPLNFLTKFF